MSGNTFLDSLFKLLCLLVKGRVEIFSSVLLEIIQPDLDKGSIKYNSVWAVRRTLPNSPFYRF